MDRKNSIERSSTPEAMSHIAWIEYRKLSMLTPKAFHSLWSLPLVSEWPNVLQRSLESRAQWYIDQPVPQPATFPVQDLPQAADFRRQEIRDTTDTAPRE